MSITGNVYVDGTIIIVAIICVASVLRTLFNNILR
jgi:hypothetical protein